MVRYRVSFEISSEEEISDSAITMLVDNQDWWVNQLDADVEIDNVSVLEK